MTTHIKSINRNVWKVVETKIEIEDSKNPTVAEEVLLQNNGIALSVIHICNIRLRVLPSCLCSSIRLQEKPS